MTNSISPTDLKINFAEFLTANMTEHEFEISGISLKWIWEDRMAELQLDIDKYELTEEQWDTFCDKFSSTIEAWSINQPKIDWTKTVEKVLYYSAEMLRLTSKKAS